MNRKNVINVNTLSEVIDRFDGFIIDQFGVLHDGQRPYPDAINTLQMLMDAGKTVVILSNSGKRSSVNVQRMIKIGFARNLFSEFVTSGDVAFDKVRSIFSDKRTCLLIARDGDVSAVDGLPLELTDDAAMADLVIISASEGDKYSEQYYIDLLTTANKRQLPCLCTNPDKLMLTQNGIRFGAGRIAELYEQMGGNVQWIGKPYKDVYEYTSRYLNTIRDERVLCIGDSLEHDIAGGASAGYKTLFVRGGIHQDMDEAELKAAMSHYAVTPDFQLDFFR
ncbi:MAG: TIGR01459 family HAD-type hydrolase [Granulosicoccus sp.]